MLAGRIAEAPQFLAAYRDYRGTTAAGLDAAEAAGFDDALRRALAAATEASRRLGQD
ncbi:pyrroline-5-carboxylate reductase dimerization domain-containing protein [Paracoccus yeei]